MAAEHPSHQIKSLSDYIEDIFMPFMPFMFVAMAELIIALVGLCGVLLRGSGNTKVASATQAVMHSGYRRRDGLHWCWLGGQLGCAGCGQQLRH
jgi:hypothetical protein